ncbi:hypothetical protein MKX03_006343 [Papaver bracteatum]|nr:hypothetical protein MKX03_006343 [Papaver bracteatum]
MLWNCYPSFNLVLYVQIDCKRWFSCLFAFRSSNELQVDLPNNTSNNALLVDSISKSGSSNDSRKVSREDIELVVLTLLNRVRIESRSPYKSSSHVYRRRRSLSRDYEIQTNGVVRHTPDREEVKFSDQEHKALDPV